MPYCSKSKWCCMLYIWFFWRQYKWCRYIWSMRSITTWWCLSYWHRVHYTTSFTCKASNNIYSTFLGEMGCIYERRSDAYQANDSESKNTRRKIFKFRILDRVIPINLHPIASQMVNIASCLVNLQECLCVWYWTRKKMLWCKHPTILINPFFPNGLVLYPLKMSENLSGLQMVPGHTKIEHWKVNGLTHFGFFIDDF